MPLVVDAHADRTALGVIGQSEEHVLLPAVSDEEAAQRSVPQHAVGVLHYQRSPVEAAALELGCCFRDDLAVLLAGEDGKVGEIDGGHPPRVRLRGGSLLKPLRLRVE